MWVLIEVVVAFAVVFGGEFAKRRMRTKAREDPIPEKPVGEV